VLAGLKDLDRVSRARNGRLFIDATESEQVALLTTLDHEAQQARQSSGDEHWFLTFKFLTVWGYCTAEVVQRETFKAYPFPGRYDGCAPYQSPA
jgi:hypothetical protein